MSRNHVLLLQLDGKMPNLALMRLSQHHRTQGDIVTFRNARNPTHLERHLWDAPWQQVYASLLFTRTQPLARRLLGVYPNAILGGTGWDVTVTLETRGIRTQQTDYSIYPGYQASIGFTQRGCRLRCPFCVVPRKEGTVQSVASIGDIWRGEPYPRHIILLDNDFFGQTVWPQRIDELRWGRFRVSFTQGINARTLNDETAAAIASVRYSDDQFQRPRLYTAWDNRKDEQRLFAGLEALVKYGVKPDHLMVYMLIGYWPGETMQDRLYRQQRLREFGCRPYPMTYVRTPELVGFQRWVVGAYDKRIPWEEWERAHYQPSNLGERAQTPLQDDLVEMKDHPAISRAILPF